MVTKKAVLAVLVCAPLAAFGQSESHAHPADAAAAGPALEYRSTFSDYRTFREEPLASWPRLHLELGPSLWGSGSQAVQKPAANAPEPERAPAASTVRPPQAPRGHSSHSR
jgi:hypothetical protein